MGAEPLVRNLLIGRAVCRRFGGEPAPTGYLPDSFGHPLQLPQILAGFGIQSFVFSRGMGDELEEIGPVFRWGAPDGSEVLAFQLLDHYGNFAFLADADDAERRIHALLERFGDLIEQGGVPDVLLCNGTDHVSVQPELPTLCAELSRRFPEDRFKIAKYGDYVAGVGQIDAPVWSGELLGSRIQNVLRGVNSARMYVKQANEQAERRLLAAETVGALRSLTDGWTFPREDFILIWRQLLRCHPHDTICGCSCDEVHRDAMARYESLGRSLAIMEDRALHGLAAGEVREGVVGVVNVLPQRRRGLIEVPGAAPQVVELDGFAARTVAVSPLEPGPEPDRGESAIESDRFRVQASPDGTVTVLDKDSGSRYTGWHRLEDEADMGDLYNFCPVEGLAGWRGERAAVKVLRSGPLVYELELTVRAERIAGLDGEARPLQERGSVDVTTTVRLVDGAERVEFRTVVENQASDHRLRVVFPLEAADGPQCGPRLPSGSPDDPPCPRRPGPSGWSRPTPRSTHWGRSPTVRSRS